MTDAAITVEGLTKRFRSVVALDGVDFDVPPATVFGLLGPNGAGKTTAIRILTTIIRPDAGRAVVLGRDVVREPRAVRARIGLAGQNAAVDPNLTGRENLRLIGRLAQMPRSEIAPRVDELLDRFGLTGARDRPVRTYSGGMRRRLDVAAALVQGPPVLFLDEPTTGLDLPSRNGLWDMINELVVEGTTVVLTTQYLEEADRLAHDIAVVDRGHVIARGSPEDLKRDLGNTVIEIGLADEHEAARVQDLVTPFVPGEPEREGASVRLSSGDGPRVLIEVLRSLDAHDLTPSKLAVREPSLDDVFLSLTGRHAEPVSEAEPVPEEGSR